MSLVTSQTKASCFKYGFEKIQRILPVQLYPSPSYPGLQEQVNDP